MYKLEEETDADFNEVEALYDLCFAPGRTALSSYRLRDNVPRVGPLCLVLRDDTGARAEESDSPAPPFGGPVVPEKTPVAGVIRYWPVKIAGQEVLLLGPVAIHPTRQGEGLGGILIRESLARARALGWGRVLLVGDEPYYRRFGFTKREGVTMPPPTNPDRVLSLELIEGAWAGVEGPSKRRVKRLFAQGGAGRARARLAAPQLPPHIGGMTQDLKALAPHAQVMTDDLAPEAAREVARLAQRWRRANGPVIALLNTFGGRLEDQLAKLPKSLRARIETATHAGLEQAWAVARHGTKLPGSGPRGTLAVAIGSGVIGGAGGLVSAIGEIPVTITILLHAIRDEAKAAGFDPDDPWIAAESLRCFSAGSPLAEDDGVNTAFLSARITLTGPALQRLIASVAPRFASALGQKLAAQTVPVLGAITGAALNAAYLRYYREIAAVRFGLLRLAQEHGQGDVLARFTQETRAQPTLPRRAP